MDYKGIIDFNKYTLALAAGGLIYAFEQLPKFKEGFSIFVLLGLLAMFVTSFILAVALFAAATRSLHLPDDRKGELDSFIRHSGTWHSITLLIAVVFLGSTMFIHTMTELRSVDREPICCCKVCR